MSLSGDPTPGAVALRMIAVARPPTRAKIPYAGKEKYERDEWSGVAEDARQARAAIRDMGIRTLWREGLNTLEIAEKLSWPESLIANRLAAIRDGAAR